MLDPLGQEHAVTEFENVRDQGAVPLASDANDFIFNEGLSHTALRDDGAYQFEEANNAGIVKSETGSVRFVEEVKSEGVRGIV